MSSEFPSGQMNRRNKETRRIAYGIVEGGHDADPDPNQTGRVRVRQVDKQGKDIPTNHLPFVQTCTTSDGQNEFNRPPRPGQAVLLMVEEDGYCHVIGPAPGAEKAGEKTMAGGGKSLDSVNPQLPKNSQVELEIETPPNVSTENQSNDTGLPMVTKKVEEKGQQVKHGLYEGLPTTGGLFSMGGLRVKNLIGISTARNPLSESLTPEVLSKMQGQAGFDIGSIMSQVTDKIKSEVMGSMSPQMQAATTNLLALLPSEKSLSSPGNFDFGGKVDPSTFMNNAMNAIKGATNLGELETAFGKINDTSNIEFTGLGALANVTIEIDGAHGPMNQSVNPVTGKISVSSGNDTIDQLIQAFLQLLQGIPSSSADGSPFFGQNSQMDKLKERMGSFASVKSMKEALERMSPDKTQERRQLHQGKGVTGGSSWLSSGGASSS